MSTATDNRRKVERAYLEGVSARQIGKTASANPYRDSQRQAQREQWARGWLDEDGARRAAR
jgi:ribosome modulation factor